VKVALDRHKCVTRLPDTFQYVLKLTMFHDARGMWCCVLWSVFQGCQWCGQWNYFANRFTCDI